MAHVGNDIFGNIALLKFDRKTKIRDKKNFASKFLNSSVKTVLEKTGKFKGRLRKQTTKFLKGQNTKEVLYRENSCVFRFNIDSCYFSPRLATERKEIANKVKKKENVLVMFGGVAPYAIVIAKMSKARKVTSIEISRECTKYAKVNVKRNKLDNIIEVIQGNVRKKLSKEKFDRIIMARPRLKESFLDIAFSKIRKNGIIHYYGFYEEKNVRELKNLIETEARNAKKKVRIQKIKKAGDIGPYRFRYRADIKIIR